MIGRIKVENPRPTFIGFKIIRWVAFWLVALVPLPPLLIFGVYVFYARELPPLEPIETYYAQLKTPTTFHAADGLVIGEFFEERRLFLPLTEIPIPMIQAFLAAEDERFFEHTGVDPRSIVRAAVANLTAGRVVEGASTLTQQLAKSMVGSEKSYVRKVREAILARRMEDIYSKSEILTLYLNKIFLGHNSYGVQAAAQNYFRKNVSDLTLGEMAVLSVLPPSPSTVNPVRNLKKTLERRRHVLDRMAKNGFISRKEAEAAKDEPVVAYPLLDEFTERMPLVADAGRKALVDLLGADVDKAAWRRGYKVHTTVEIDLQHAAARALSEEIASLDRKQGYRGPVGALEPDEVEATLERALSYYLEHGMLDDQSGDKVLQDGTTYLGVVTDVSKQKVSVRVTPEIGGVLSRKQMKWAGAYKEYPLLKEERRVAVAVDGDDDAGGKLGTVEKVTVITRRDESARVSWRPKLKDCRKAFVAGDAVLVRADKEGALKLTQTPRVQGAVLSWSPWTGYTRAMVGGTDYDLSQVNRVNALRQTGSTMKPIYYALAYDMGLRPSYPVSDAPYARGSFQSAGGSSDAGAMLTYTGLVKSRNTVSLRVSEYVTNHLKEKQLGKWATQLGLAHALKGHRAEILGGDQTMWSMSGAFARFLNGGLEPERTVVRKIVDKHGQVLVDRTSFGDASIGPRETLAAMGRTLFARKARRLRASTAYLMRHNLRSVVKAGTATKARKLKRVVAGKTGSLPFDVWFNGFDHEHVTTAWVGADVRERTLGRSKGKSGVYGAGVPLSVFMRVATLAGGERRAGDFLAHMPDSIEMVTVDPKTGNRTTEGGVSLPHRKAFIPIYVHKGEGTTEDIHHAETDF